MSDRGQHTRPSPEPFPADPTRAEPALPEPVSAAPVPSPAADPGAADIDPGATGAGPADPDAASAPADAASASAGAAGFAGSTAIARIDASEIGPAGRSAIARPSDISHSDAAGTDIARLGADSAAVAATGVAALPGAGSPALRTGSADGTRSPGSDPAHVGPDGGPDDGGRAGIGPGSGGSPDVLAAGAAADSDDSAAFDEAVHPPAEGSRDVPFEISAATDGEGDAPFRLTAPQSDEDEPATTPAPGNTRKIVLAGLLAVALAGAVALAWFGWQVNSQRQTTLSTPAKVAGLTLDDSEQATATADYLQTALVAEIPMTKAVGAVYTGEDEKSVLFFGGTTLLWSPESDLDSAIQLMSDDQGAVTDVKEVDAGDFGGTMKCGATKSTEGDLAVCGWADHGSLALAMFPNRTQSEAAPLMRELRSAIQTRS